MQIFEDSKLPYYLNFLENKNKPEVNFVKFKHYFWSVKEMVRKTLQMSALGKKTMH